MKQVKRCPRFTTIRMASDGNNEAMPNKCNPSHVIKYIGRYLGRPVIATSRIDSYDGLTQHIPEKHFKMIRYYGIYARHRKSDQSLHRAISREKHKIFLSFNRWRDSILHTFGYDPLKCPSCGTTMLFLELYFNHKPVPLHELYERAMRKHRCRPPASPSSLSQSPVTWYNQRI